MAQYSQPWNGTILGDAGTRAPYSADEWDDYFRDMFRNVPGTWLDDGGVFSGVLGEFGVTVLGANSLRVSDGAGMANGKWYYNDADIDWVIPNCATPGQTRIDRMVISASWNDVNDANRDPAVQDAYTIRMIRKIGVDGAGVPPALVNTDGTLWETDIEAFETTDAGVITLRPDLANRTYLNKYVHTRFRRGGDGTHWYVGGDTPYAVRGGPFTQWLAVTVTITDGNVSAMTTVDFPTPYVESIPIVMATPYSEDSVAGEQIATAGVDNITLEDVDVWATRADPGDTTGDETVTVFLLVVGNYGYV